MVWQSPKVWGYFFGKFPLETGGFPRQFENWLGMTAFIRLHLPLLDKLKLEHFLPAVRHTLSYPIFVEGLIL
jgi:hypothetical protein